MVIQLPGKGRAVINEYGDKIEVIIPNKRDLLLLFVGFIMALGGIAAVAFQTLLERNFGHKRNLFIWIWISWACIISLLGIRYLLFALGGKEVWIFEGEYFSLVKTRPWGNKTETFNVNLMFGVRVNEDDYVYTPSNGFGQTYIDVINLNKGTFIFDYGRDTWRVVGNGLSEAEAIYLIEYLKGKNILKKENFY